MKLLRVFLVIVALGFAGGSAPRAQDVSSADALQAARELVAVTSAVTVFDLAAKQTEHVWPAWEAALQKQHPSIDDATLAALRQDFERLQFAAIVEGLDEMAEVYTRQLSITEMRAMIAFYRTSVGMKALAVMPRLTAESLEALSPRLKAARHRFGVALTEVPQGTETRGLPHAVGQLVDAERRQQDAESLIAKLVAQAQAAQEAAETKAAVAKAAAEHARLKEVLLDAAQRRRAAAEQFAAELKAARERLKEKAAAAEAAKAEAAKKSAPPAPDAKPAQDEDPVSKLPPKPLPKAAPPQQIIIGHIIAGKAIPNPPIKARPKYDAQFRVNKHRRWTSRGQVRGWNKSRGRR